MIPGSISKGSETGETRKPNKKFVLIYYCCGQLGQMDSCGRQYSMCLRVVQVRGKWSWIFTYWLLLLISWKLLLGCISSPAFSVRPTLWLNRLPQLQKVLMLRDSGGVLRNGDSQGDVDGPSMAFATLGYEAPSPSACRI